MPPFCCVGLSCAVFTPVEAPAASSQVALSRLRCASVARVSAALCPLGFCFEAVTRDVTLRAFGSALPGNRCDCCKRQASEFRRLRTYMPAARLDRLKWLRAPHVSWRARSSLPADQIVTLGRAETCVVQTKARIGDRAAAARRGRPLDSDPSDGDAETRRSGAVVLECRPSVSKHFTLKLFDRLNELCLSLGKHGANSQPCT